MKRFTVFIVPFFITSLLATQTVDQLEQQFRAVQTWYAPLQTMFITYDVTHAQRDAQVENLVRQHSGTALQKKYTQQQLNMRYADEVVKRDRITIKRLKNTVKQKLKRCKKYAKLHPNNPGYVTPDELQKLRELRKALKEQKRFLKKLYTMLKQSVNV